MVHAGADLQKEPHQRDLIAYGLEEQLLEQIARLEPVLRLEVTESQSEARIVFERRRMHGLSMPSDLRTASRCILSRVLRALAIILFMLFNTAVWGTLILIGGLVKLLTFGGLRRRIIRGLPALGEQWVRGNDWIFDTFLTTRWEIEGLEEIRRDGRYLIVSNHISWIDIFALFRAFVDRGPFIRFFLKQQLIWFPIAGQACWALGFPFMRRYSAEYLKQHPEKRGRDLETTRTACRRFRHVPVSIVNFIEGTRFSREKHEDQQSPYRNLLRPRIGGIGFVLASLAEQLDAMYDVTIMYPHRDISMWDFVTNRVEWIRIVAHRIDVPAEFQSDAVTEPGDVRERFKEWVERLWREKDERIAETVRMYHPRNG